MKDWERYIARLKKISDKAAEEMQAYVDRFGFANMTAVINQAYALATKYGEAAGAAACDMYDAVAAASKVSVPPAVPAETATYGEVAKAINGAIKQASEGQVPQIVGRQVKQAGADTTLKNAIRDGAQFAWVPHGDTCAFCITLASWGWRYASKKALKGGHAEHIHSNCDCEFAIRFDGKGGVRGYDPERYKKIYYGADPNGSSKDKINAIRREQYQKNKEKINAQKREAYRKRQSDEPFYRKTGNAGVFAELSEIMSKKNIRNIAKEFNISLDHVTILIDKDPDKLRKEFWFTGRADPKKIGRIDFFPKAFVSKEELVRTLFHERVHVMQFREFGTEYVQNNRAHFEKLAYAEEKKFITKMKEAGLL